MKKSFLKLTNNIVCGKENWINKYGNKIVAVMALFDMYTNNIGYCQTTLEQLITSLNMKINQRKGEINEQIKDLLVKLKEDNIIEGETELATVKTKQMFKIKINDIVKKDVDGNDTEFFPLEYEVFNKIITHKGKVNNILLLNVYCYISARLRRNIEGFGITENNYINKDGNYHKHMEKDSKVECTFFTIEEAILDLNISNKTFIESYKELQSMDLIYVVNIGNVKKGKEVKQANNVYMLDKSYVKLAKEESEFYYKSNGYEILDSKLNDKIKKKLTDKDRKRKSYLKGKITKGTATKEAVKEYETLSG